MDFNRLIGFAIGPIASAVFGFITIPVIAWTFSIEDVGRLNMLQVIISFLLLVSVLGLDQAYVREFHESIDRAHLLKSCFTPGFIFLFVVGLPAIFFGAKLSDLIFDTKNPIFIWITFICAISAFIARFLSLILRMHEMGFEFSISQIMPKAFFFAAIYGIIFFEIANNFLALQVAFCISTITATIIYSWNTRNKWQPAMKKNIDGKQLVSLLKFSTPLIFSGVAYWALTATSVITLRSYSTFSELGIYGLTMSVAGIATIFQSIFSVVWAPIIYKWVAKDIDIQRVDRVARQALAAVCGIFLLCGLFSWVTDYILPAEYSMVKYLVLCAIVQPLLYTLSEITCVGIGISRRTLLTVWITLTALCTNVLLHIWLVPPYGATGAVAANAIAYLVFFVARTEASAYVWRQFPRARIYLFVTLAVSLALGTAALGPLLPFHYALIWLAVLPIAVWCFRLELREMVIFLRNARSTHSSNHA